MKKAKKDVLGDLKEFFVLAIRANLGMSGLEEDHDGHSVEGFIQAAILNCTLMILVVLAFAYFDLSQKIILLFSVVSLFYTFFVVFWLLPAIKSYLGIPFPPLRKKETRKDNLGKGR